MYMYSTYSTIYVYTVYIHITVYNITHIYMESRKMVMITLYAKQKKRHRCTEQACFHTEFYNSSLFPFSKYNLIHFTKYLH